MEEQEKILEIINNSLENKFRGQCVLSVEYLNCIKKHIEKLTKGYQEKEESEKYLYEAYQDAGKKMFEYAEKLEKLESRINDKIEKLKSTNTEDNLIEAIRNCEVVLLTELMEEK